MARWVCDYCGEIGQIPPGDEVEHVLCTTCGEPVLPYDQ